MAKYRYTMNNQLIYSVNNADAVGLQNTFVIDVSKPAEAVETRSYLVTLEQVNYLRYIVI